jgi:hypothetical protein
MVNADWRRLTGQMDTTRRNDTFCSQLELVDTEQDRSGRAKGAEKRCVFPGDIIGSFSDPRLNLISAGVNYRRVVRDTNNKRLAEKPPSAQGAPNG